MGKYFVYDSEGDGFVNHFETEEEALSYAKTCIDDYLDDGWDENVVFVCAGKITHRAKQCETIKHLSKSDLHTGEAGMPEGWEHTSLYKMQKI